MKNIIAIILLASICGNIYADQSDAEKIVAIIDVEIFPEITDPSVSEKEIERREKYDQLAQQLMAKNLEKELNAEELRATLEYLQSPAGKKFYNTVNGEKALDGLNELMDAYYSEQQNQSR